MKIISSANQTHLAGRALTLSTCWRVTRADGAVFKFTDHDQDLVVGADTFRASTGFTRSAVAADATLAATNLEIIGFVSALVEDDLRNGLWDYAEVQVFLVNWQAPSDGEIKLRRGWLGEVTCDDSGEFHAQLNGLAEVLSNKVGELYSPECRAQLGDSRCGFNLATVTASGVVGAGSSRTALLHTTLTAAAGYYDGGVIIMSSGANAGVRREVLAWDGTTLTPFLAFPHTLAEGDAFSVTPGCDRQLATCRDKFHNVLNFRGDPFVPGADALMATPLPGGSA